MVYKSFLGRAFGPKLNRFAKIFSGPFFWMRGYLIGGLIGKDYNSLKKGNIDMN